MNFFDLDKWQEVGHTLAANKKRTTATAFGVFWGIFMLVVLISISSGFKNGISKMLEGANPNTAFVSTSTTSIPYMGFKSGRSWNMNSGDIELIRKNVPEVEYIGLSIWSYQPNVIYKGKKAKRANVQGSTPEIFKIAPPKLLDGRLIEQPDEEMHRKICVIGKEVSNTLFGSEKPLGKVINVNGIYVRVIGLITNKNTGGMMGNFDNAVYIPYAVMQQNQGMGDKIPSFGFTAKGDMNTAIKKVKDILRQRHQISPKDEKAVFAMNMAEFFELTNMMLLGMDVLIWIIGIGTLLTGVIGVSNILLVTVRERTREIGVRRALGAKPTDIINQLLSESLTLTSSAGLIGMVLGILIMAGVGAAVEGSEDMPFYNPTIPFSTAIISLIIIVASGILGGLLPAYRAIQIKAIDAIRDE